MCPGQLLQGPEGSLPLVETKGCRKVCIEELQRGLAKKVKKCACCRQHKVVSATGGGAQIQEGGHGGAVGGV